MKKTISKFAAVVAATMLSTASWSADLANNGAALDAVLDGIATDGSIDVNVVTDQLGDGLDSYWQIAGSGGAVSTFIIEIAALYDTNQFGIYDKSNPANMVMLFDGAATTGDQIIMSILADGSVRVNFADTGIDFAGNAFGFYLQNPTTGFGGPATYYSDTALNADGVDHMAAYQGTGEEIQILPYSAGPWSDAEYVLAWEDWYGGGDFDFTDMVVMIESVSPIPEPSILALLGLGMLGLGFARRRRSC
jgi:hypothetical protein